MSVLADPSTRKFVIGLGLSVVVAFAAGRYTMRADVEKEVKLQYEKQLTEIITKVEERFSEKLKESVETVKKEVQTASERENDVDETITVTAAGDHNITRKIRSRESNKTNTIVKTEIKVVEVEKIVEKIVEKEVIVEVEKRVEVIKEVQTPPPAWRVYGAAAISEPTGERDPSYGAGGSYALGPIDVGGFGLYSPEKRATTIGLTAGVSF